MQIVTAENLEVAFGKFKAVKGVTFSVSPGEIFGFLGANGAGKTTTIRVLCGLLPPSGGKVMVAGADPAKDPMAVKSHVGYMSQKFTLYSDLTIGENLAFTARLRRLPDAKANARIGELMKFIDLDWPLTTYVHDLPGGVLQQVALVAATIHDPDIVFLDEPTAGVTPHARAKFWELIRKMASAGKTVFVTTHYMDEAEQCGRIALMRSGELIALGSPQELKKMAFKTPIYEITAPDSAPAGWAKALSAQKFIEAVETFGMRYHLRATDAAAWDAYRKKEMGGFEIHEIPPTLEDVFIRLVEGTNR
jgi:ABC-2 type transport system ATP-binding protein